MMNMDDFDKDEDGEFISTPLKMETFPAEIFFFSFCRTKFSKLGPGKFQWVLLVKGFSWSLEIAALSKETAIMNVISTLYD